MSPAAKRRPSDRDVCGCCKGLTAQTPAPVDNRPGLQQIAYRVGTYSQFKQTMLAALSDRRRFALRDLRTRDDDDFSIALLDAWATVADVITFYQERIINESYLRTAAERQSVLEMARCIGYELNPGVAASTYLAFNLETAEGSPVSIRIDAGLKMQSVPGQDEQAQVFETIEQIEARGEWNELKVRTARPIQPRTGDTSIYLKGIPTDLKPGDVLLLVGDERLDDHESRKWDLCRVKDIEKVPPAEPTADLNAGHTVVTLDRPLGSRSPDREPPEENPCVYVLRKQAALFGHNAPDWRAMSRAVKASYLWTTVDDAKIDSQPDWPNFTIKLISYPPPPPDDSGFSKADLAGKHFTFEEYAGKGIKKEALKRMYASGKIDAGWADAPAEPDYDQEVTSFRLTGRIRPEATGQYVLHTHSCDGVRLWVDGKKIIDNWTDHAEIKDSGTVELEAGREYDVRIEHYHRGTSPRVRLTWSPPGMTEVAIPDAQLCATDTYPVHLDMVYPEISIGSWVVLSTPEDQELYTVEAVAEEARANFALSSKTTRLTLKGQRLLASFNTKVRETVVFSQSEYIETAPTPDLSPVSGTSVVLDRRIDSLNEGRLVAVFGLDSVTGLPTGEVIKIDRIGTVDNLTRLVFSNDLKHTYRRDKVVINANVAAATHGESTEEVLGNGDAAVPFQSFTLRQPPLTYVSAATPSGAETTLTLYVNDILWREVPSLYGHVPEERIYVARTDDDGKTTVRFGDGRTGARLPTGSANVQAKYRKGVGLGGQVKANQISQLLTMPLGLKTATNPVPATGAQDRESLSEARRNAPLTVLTLGRVVSLKDYEDFARSFGGIAKALATWTWDGEKRGVFLTVAGPRGAAVATDSPIYENLLAALRKAGDPHVPLRVETYREACFRVAGNLKVLQDYKAGKVLAAVEREVRQHFSFEARLFGQPVALSEIVAIIHQVPGVLAVSVDELYRVGRPGSGGDRKRIPRKFRGVIGSDMSITERHETLVETGVKRKTYSTGRDAVVDERFAETAAWRKMPGGFDSGWAAYVTERVTGPDAVLKAAMPEVGEGGPLAAELLILDPGPVGLEVVS